VKNKREKELKTLYISKKRARKEIKRAFYDLF